MSILIYRELTIKDLKAFKKISLNLLKNSPKSFGSDYEEEYQFDDQFWVPSFSE